MISLLTVIAVIAVGNLIVSRENGEIMRNIDKGSPMAGGSSEPGTKTYTWEDASCAERSVITVRGPEETVVQWCNRHDGQVAEDLQKYGSKAFMSLDDHPFFTWYLDTKAGQEMDRKGPYWTN